MRAFNRVFGRWSGWIMIFGMAWTVPAFAQATGGGGGTGLIQPASYQRGCPEGRKSWFHESTSGGDHYVQVLRTCHNGSYYDLSDYVYNPKMKCAEGRTEIWLDTERGSGKRYQMVKVCRNGKWVDGN
jgi:hypothetical protein